MDSPECETYVSETDCKNCPNYHRDHGQHRYADD